MHHFLSLFLLFNLILSPGLGAQKELAVADFGMLVDTLLTDYQMQKVVNAVTKHYQTAFRKEVVDFNKKAEGCGPPEKYLEQAFAKLKLRGEIHEKVLDNLAKSTKEYAEEVVQKIVADYSSRKGAQTVLSSEHILYRSNDIPDLTQWLVAFSRRDEHVKRVIDFGGFIRQSLLPLK